MNAYMAGLAVLVVVVMYVTCVRAVRSIRATPAPEGPDVRQAALEAAHAENARLRVEMDRAYAELRESRRANVLLVAEARKLIAKEARADEAHYEDPPSVLEADRQVVEERRAQRRRERLALAVHDDDVPAGIAAELPADADDDEEEAS